MHHYDERSNVAYCVYLVISYNSRIPAGPRGQSMSKARFTDNAQLTLPLEYLTSSSDTSLRNFEMMQLNHAANLEKEIEAMRRERDRANVMAEVARMLIDNRTELLKHVGNHLERVRGERSDAA